MYDNAYGRDDLKVIRILFIVYVYWYIWQAEGFGGHLHTTCTSGKSKHSAIPLSAAVVLTVLCICLYLCSVAGGAH